MGNSLLEQLQKAGLVDEKRAKAAQKAKRQQHRQTRQRKGGDDEARKRREQAAAEQAKRDRELEAKRAERKARKERAAQLKQLVVRHRLPRVDDGVAFNFTDGGAIKRLTVSPEVQRQIAAGQLAVVRLSGLYEVVPLAIVERIRERDAEAIVVCNTATETQADGEDPYAEYEVPDDLMW